MTCSFVKRLFLHLESPFKQYLVGTGINFLLLTILISNNTSYRNLQLPEGPYSDNLWQGTDVVTYVNPARNFIHFRVFGSGTDPDHHRTIGYPLFLSILMFLFGHNWFILALFVQSLVFASIYPALSRISTILFNLGRRALIFSFLFFIISGTYIAMVPVIMSDLFFSVLFIIGLYFGLEAIIKKSWGYLFFHILFLGYSAQVRPLLTIYPFINFLILLYVSRKSYLFLDAKLYSLIITSSVVLILVCNLPSIRNYINHGFLKPTDVLYNNMFDYLGYNILKNSGRIREYNAMQDKLQEVKDLSEKMSSKQKLAINIYKSYPLQTFTQLIKNSIGIMLRSHWSIVANFWGYNFNDNFDRPMPLRKLNFVFVLESFFNIIYLILYILFLNFLVRQIRLRSFEVFLILILFISYFLIPAFMVNGAGSRMRLPVEGIILLASFNELQQYLRLSEN
jgi:hypothetical protein